MIDEKNNQIGLPPPPQTQHSFDLNCLSYDNISVVVNVLAVILFDFVLVLYDNQIIYLSLCLRNRKNK